MLYQAQRLVFYSIKEKWRHYALLNKIAFNCTKYIPKSIAATIKALLFKLIKNINE